MPITWQPKSLVKLTSHPGRFYSYAPSVIQENALTRLWWCQNEKDGFIKDSIYYAEQRSNSSFTTPPQAVFRASAPPAWDSYHVCDPSVVAGKFRLDGAPYRYALFYLGNDVNASRHNQVGVAFADRPDGDWKRVADPVVAHVDDHSWGVGQPSALNPDGEGRVLLFYTSGDREGTHVYSCEVELSDTLTDRNPVVGTPRRVSKEGLTGTTGLPDGLNNADFALNSRRDRFFVVRDQHPNPKDNPRFISGSVQVASIEAAAMLRGGGVWRVEGEITPALTGLARNHDAGLVRDAFGVLPERDNIGVVFASSDAGPTVKMPLWTYDLWRIDGTIGP